MPTCLFLAGCVSTNMAEEEDDLVAQTEELEALSAIYGDDLLIVDEVSKIIELRIRCDVDSWWSVTLQVLIPPNYPSRVPPVFQVFSECLVDADLFEISDKLHNDWRDNEGQSILYAWVETVREILNQKYETDKTLGLEDDEWQGEGKDQDEGRPDPGKKNPRGEHSS